ncbi:MAG: TIM barrel protein [Candidatus Micrarchaeota archaeon]
MNKLHFGTAGIPLSAQPRETVNGISQIHALGLDSMELEFVRSVNITDEKAPEVQKIAKQENVLLTCHASYFINLNAVDKAKIEASKKRILHAARTLEKCGGWSVCFHPGFYLKSSKTEAYANVKKSISQVVDVLKMEKNKVWIRPETTGKHSQFGNLEETLQLCSELDQCLPCIDFSHLRAYTLGKLNNYEEYCNVLEKVEKTLGKTALQNLHLHCQGIEWTDKGERRHLEISEDKNWNYSDLMKALKDYKSTGVVVCESPNLETDALILKKSYEKL